MLVDSMLEENSDKPWFEMLIETAEIRTAGNLDKALDTLDHLSAYQPGKFVFHPSGWGVGRIDDLDTGTRELAITFEDGRGHEMPLSSALEALNPIDSEDWRVLRAFDQERFKDECEHDPGGVVARVLRQLDRPTDPATVRDLLKDRVIPAASWSKWWAKARKAALSRPDVEIFEGRGSKLIFRERVNEDPLAAMRDVLSAPQVRDLALDFYNNMPPEVASDDDRMREFCDVLIKSSALHAPEGSPAPLELALLADEVARERKLDTAAIDARLEQMVRDQRTYEDNVIGLKQPRWKRRALDHFKRVVGDGYLDQLLQLVPHADLRLLDYVIDDLLEGGRSAQIKKILAEAMRRPTTSPELVVWLRRPRHQKRYPMLMKGIDPKALLYKCIGLGEVESRVTPRLKQLQKVVATELLNDNAKEFRAYLRAMTAEEADIMRRRIDGLRGVTDKIKYDLLDVFYSEHQRPSASDEELAPHLDEEAIYATREGVLKQQEAYEKLVNEDLPRVFEAIGRAAAFGDLSENAEYTAAIEERAALTRKAEEMQSELQKARPIEPDLLDDGQVTLGSRATVKNLASGEDETYTFLGPWDSDFERGILDYRAPLAQAFLGNPVGAKIEVVVGGRSRSYEILSVEPALG